MDCSATTQSSKKRSPTCASGLVTTSSKPAVDRNHQPFPTAGLLSNRLDVPRSRIEKIVDSERDGTVYAYVLSTATWDRDDKNRVIQRGAAPNYQGGRITLCNCKHSMRAGRKAQNWTGVWIAGFTSVGHRNLQGLFYLMRVERGFESYAELWKALSPSIARAKSVSRHRLGDLFEPNSMPNRNDSDSAFHQETYKPIYDKHVHWPEAWRRDLDYRHDKKSLGRKAALLLGAEQDSYLWEKPSLCYDGKLTQGCRKFHSIANLLAHLKVIK